MKCRYFCRLPLDISPVYLTRGISHINLLIGGSFLFAKNPAGKAKMYLHRTENGHYTPPCCYFSGELEVVELRQ